MKVVVGVVRVEGFRKVLAGEEGHVVAEGEHGALVVDVARGGHGVGATCHAQGRVLDFLQSLGRAAAGRVGPRWAGILKDRPADSLVRGQDGFLGVPPGGPREGLENRNAARGASGNVFAVDVEPQHGVEQDAKQFGVGSGLKQCAVDGDVGVVAALLGVRGEQGGGALLNGEEEVPGQR